jgi:hypothetical protein
LNNLTITSTGSISLPFASVFGTLTLNSPVLTLLTYATPVGINGISTPTFPLNVVANSITGSVATFSPSGTYSFGVPTIAANSLGGAGVTSVGHTLQFTGSALLIDSDFFNGLKVIMIPATGAQSLNVAGALAGATPQEQFSLGASEPLDAAIIDFLRKMGIYAVPPSPEEALAAQDGYGVIYNNIAKTDAPGPSDRQPTSSRISSAAAMDVYNMYNNLFYQNGDPTKESQVPKIQAAFNETYQSYAATAGSATPAGYQAYLGSNAATNPQAAAALNYLNQFRALFSKIDNMGLAGAEEDGPKNNLLRGMGPSTSFMEQLLVLPPPTAKVAQN